MTDDMALREAAIQLLARDEEDAGQDLTEWARQAIEGDHLDGCHSVAMTCPACLRENYEEDVRRIVDAYLAARDDARLAERERCAAIVEACADTIEQEASAIENTILASVTQSHMALLRRIVAAIRAGEGP